MAHATEEIIFRRVSPLGALQSCRQFLFPLFLFLDKVGDVGDEALEELGATGMEQHGGIGDPVPAILSLQAVNLILVGIFQSRLQNAIHIAGGEILVLRMHQVQKFVIKERFDFFLRPAKDVQKAIADEKKWKSLRHCAAMVTTGEGLQHGMGQMVFRFQFLLALHKFAHVAAHTDDSQPAVLGLHHLAPVYGPKPGAILPGHAIGGLVGHPFVVVISQVLCHLRHIIGMDGIRYLPMNPFDQIRHRVIAQHGRHLFIGIVNREIRLTISPNEPDLRIDSYKISSQ